MSIIDKYDLFHDFNKIEHAINILKDNEPSDGYILGFSGGKDSTVVYDLAKKSNVKFTAEYNITTIDPPEIINYVKNNNIKMIKPAVSMYELIQIKKILPTRKIRYCCDILKENTSPEKTKILGIRKSESYKRSKYNFIHNYKNNKWILPILDWTINDVWEYIKINKLEYCKLYDEGFKRLGCVLCPLTSKKNKLKEMQRFPNIVNIYLKAIKKLMLKGYMLNYSSPEEVLRWWVNL